MSRRALFGVGGLLALLAGGTLWVAALGPRLIVPQAVPDDVRVITDDAWPRFLETFGAHHECIGDVTLLLVFDVPGGAAAYRSETATVEVEIPTTPERFEESLVHELGHHLEHRCGVVAAIGDDFRDAQSLSGDADWFRRDPWFEAPTEHFAEAVVAVTLDRRGIHADRIDLTPRAIDLVDRWARGG